MARPHPALSDLAAGRDWPDPGPSLAEVIADARRHRLAGMLWSAVRHRPDVGSSEERSALRSTWLAQRLVTQRMVRALGDVVRHARACDITLVAFKGPTAEARWFPEQGTRPSVDIDVVLPLSQRHRAGDLLRLLCPQHPLVDDLQRLVDSRLLQSVTFPAPESGVAVDLHLDPLKVEGLWSRIAGDAEAGAFEHALPDGSHVLVHDASVSLVQHALHLNKDRFRSLRGFADVARIIRDPSLDWARVHDLVARDGLEVPVTRTVEAVVDGLGLPPTPLPHLHGWRAEVWDVAWPTSVWFRRSSELRQRQLLLPLLARGRTTEALGRTVRRLAAPSSQVAYYLGRPELAELSYPALTRERIRARVFERGARRTS